jgi:serine/threonine protein kinase
LLENRYVRPGEMSTAQVHCVMRQLLTALQFMHSAGFVHRDVKVRPGAEA